MGNELLKLKVCVKNPFFSWVLITALASMLAGRVMAQTFTTLHSFTATSPSAPYANIDGANPNGGLILSGNILYGTTYWGGSGASSPDIDRGTAFSLRTDGTGFTTLVNYNDSSVAVHPDAGLLLSGTNLYGTTLNPSFGTVFAVNTNGAAFEILYRFSGSDGMNPEGGLISSGNTLYGTTQGAGLSPGTVFAINMDGSAFSVLYNFSGADGMNPTAGLVLSGNTLYGTTRFGGSSDAGTVFSVNTDGTSFTNLYNFSGGGDGGNVLGGLVLASNVLYGTTRNGGSSGSGTIFAIHTDGTGFTNLYSFTPTPTSPPYTNIEGAFPSGTLVLVDKTLYGTAEFGGSSGNGTVFAISTDGMGFVLLHGFTADSGSPGRNLDGANPSGSLTLGNAILYGTAENGGSAGNGTVFSISLASTSSPLLTITSAGPNVILTWPTNAAGFTLQSTMDLASQVWTTNSPAPVVVNGQYTVANRLCGKQQFFRLSQ